MNLPPPTKHYTFHNPLPPHNALPIGKTTIFYFIYLDEGIADPPVYLFQMLHNWDVTNPNFEYHQRITDSLPLFLGEHVAYIYALEYN